MTATPQYATFAFRGLRSGESFFVDAYLSDVANANVNFDGGAGAGSSSPDGYVFDEPAVLTDFSIKTGMADTTAIRLTSGGRPLQQLIRYANHLNTMSVRPRLNVGFKAGSRFGAIQLA